MATDMPVRNTAQLPRLLSIRQLAEYLEIPVSTIYLWRSQGKGPHGLKVGKQVRYRAEDVLAWLEKQAGRTP
jgi:excisionase family DNA binding protein